MNTPFEGREEPLMLLEAFALPSPLHGSDCMWCGITRQSGQPAAGLRQDPGPTAAPGLSGAP
ncbi:hypothetical protein V2W30_39070 [Streptomyces sp. Q6]|uniref:Uncharacterized protein n=1 Tax=Streptomyces citrinus TaxID=3118173 RepID=A0ACD5AN93_9ACTN